MRNIIVSVVFTLVFGSLNVLMAQTLTVCKSVDKDGHPVNAAQEFSVAKDGGKVVFLLQLPPAIHPAAVSYDVYKIDKGKEVFSSTLKQPLEPNKNWLLKEVTFYDAGSYRVYVYDDKDNQLTKANFSIKASGN